MADKELRVSFGELEVRADDGGKSVKVGGYAAVFNEETNIADVFREVIAPGAFKRAIEDGDDVVFLVNHDGEPLARTTSGTLTLREDKRGLWMEAELDASDPDALRVIPKMRRGDLSQMSFAMRVTAERWDEVEEQLPLRTIEEVELRDVSIVTRPAYDGTEIGLRSLEAARAEARPDECDRAKAAVTDLRLRIAQALM